MRTDGGLQAASQRRLALTDLDRAFWVALLTSLPELARLLGVSFSITWSSSVRAISAGSWPDYLDYYQLSRTHLSLGNDAPEARDVQQGKVRPGTGIVFKEAVLREREFGLGIRPVATMQLQLPTV